ncbi:MAG: ATP-binding cassette domain-containing protein [Desulfurococcales archaeon]|jgi:peptide/nickel transport system ATP-binding protein|nr:ATP-binding cassette domain-containing protein [Desulfurococcales archaeon]
MRGIVKAVDNVSFSLEKETVLGIAGESGSGKSTLAWSIMGLPPPPGRIIGGRIFIDGIDVLSLKEEERRRKILWQKVSMVFQGAINAFNPVYTIGYQIAEPLMLHRGYSKKEALQKAVELVKSVGLNPDVIHRYPHELSGGMKQRAVIAMALVLDPPLLIADEPTTALDVVVQAQILNLLKKLKFERKLSVILITHDLSVIAELADYVAVMYAGRIVEYGPIEEVYNNPRHPYTQLLLSSIPRLRGTIDKLRFIPGEPPDLINPPKGCKFHPRCPFVFDECRVSEPDLITVGENHLARCWLASKR